MNPEQKSVPEATLRDGLAKARVILAETRAVIRAGFQKDFQFQRKADQSWVTEIDLAVERLLRERLQEKFPGYGIIGEEFPEQNKVADWTWVIDPIDGTSSLRHHVPLFGTILALLQEGKCVVGLIDLPMLGRLYGGAAGLGVWCKDGGAVGSAGSNDRQLHIADVSGDAEILSELISLGGREQYISSGVPEVFDDLFRLHPHTRTYGDCFGHAMVLEGAVGAMVDFDLRLWDVAATEAMVQEAGGKFVCVRQRDGKDDSPVETRYDVIFGKPRVVNWILQRLKIS